MTHFNNQILFTALGFTAVILQGDPGKIRGAEKALKFAKLIEEFCALHVAGDSRILSVNLVDDVGATTIDQSIDRHITELRDDESTVLPADKETLIKFYDRLQQRKTRRAQKAFYAMADLQMLADIVLKHLDEEIEEGEAS